MDFSSRLNKIEKSIYIIFFILILLIPLILSPSKQTGVNWHRVLHTYLTILPFCLVFIINNFYFFFYFLKKKYSKYAFYITTYIVFISFISIFTYKIQLLLGIPIHKKQTPKTDFIWYINQYFFSLMISTLVVGFSVAYKLIFIWIKEVQKNIKLENENNKNQLLLLKHQLNPHFLMNTLNNIHALIDYDNDLAKKSVIKLSKLLRIMLNDLEHENYTLSKEIAFLTDYIELMKIRVSKRVLIDFKYKIDDFNVKIPSLLLINFVENSFKHGIKARGESYIRIEINCDKSNIYFKCQNSKADQNIETHSNNNIGINNIKKRLELIYFNSYDLKISSSNDEFIVDLIIPIHEN